MDKNTKQDWCYVSYVRVSGLSQDSGDGPERQRIATDKLAKSRNGVLLEEYYDKGETGKIEDDNNILGRPEMSRLISDLRSGKHGPKVCVCIERLDRVARDILIQEMFLHEVYKAGHMVLSATDDCLEKTGDEYIDASRKLLRQVLGSFAEYDRTVTVLKLRDARRRKKIHNAKTLGLDKCDGKKRFGEMLGKNDSRTPDRVEHEMQCLKRIVELSNQEVSTTEIAMLLNCEGYKPRKAVSWTGHLVWSVINNWKKKESVCLPQQNTLEKSETATERS